MSPRKLIGARDPYGFKPLCIGKRDNAYVLASESCALDTIGAEFIRDVNPGEIVTITKDGIQSDCDLCLPKEKTARCIFEYIYFARPDSEIDGVGVYHSRIQAGRYLAQDSPVEADLVVGVPESGHGSGARIFGTVGNSVRHRIPQERLCRKNISSSQDRVSRESKRADQAERDRRGSQRERRIVIMVDDSIVRGTTSDRTLSRCSREAGATEVHVRISSPPFLHGHATFGTDVPAR